MYLDEEGMVDLSQNIPLHHDSFNLILFLDIFLLHRLDSEELSGLLVADQDDLCVGALADD